MAAILSYGGYSSGDDEAELTMVEKQPILSGRGKRLYRQEKWHIKGELMQSTPALIISAANDLINAFAEDGKTATFSVGGTVAHRLSNESSDCISGVRVAYASFAKQDPAELATVRTYSIVLQASYDAVEDNLVSWQDSIEITGTGGLYYVAVQTIDGPRAIIISGNSGVYYTQTGQAVGYQTYPDPPGPIDPAGEFVYRRRTKQTSGKNMGKQIRFYTTQWAYYYARDPSVFGQFGQQPSSK